MKGISFEQLDGSSLRVGIVLARWNKEYVDSLLEGCKKALRDSGVKDENIIIKNVPGSFELVYGSKHLIDHESVDVVIAIGVLIKGETMHFEHIADAVSQGLTQLNATTPVPSIFGVLTCLTEEQVKLRSVGENNHGYSWGMSAVEMGLLKNNH